MESQHEDAHEPMQASRGKTLMQSEETESETERCLLCQSSLVVSAGFRCVYRHLLHAVQASRFICWEALQAGVSM